MAAMMVGAVDEHATHAHLVAHFAEGDLLADEARAGMGDKSACDRPSSHL
jgi:hypothetical protein